MQIFMTIRFAKDLIETFNDKFIDEFQYSVLPIFYRIA